MRDKVNIAHQKKTRICIKDCRVHEVFYILLIVSFSFALISVEKEAYAKVSM